jgi:phosphatidylinositol-3-phosphatase
MIGRTRDASGRRILRRWLIAGTAGAAALLSSGCIPPAAQPSGAIATQSTTAPLCGNPASSPGPIRHVIVVMLENHTYRQVVGSSAAPYQTRLAAECGNATAMFAATHTSAANYLATSAGEYPAGSPRGCSSVYACADSSSNLYHQLDGAGLSWRAYAESMTSACSGSSGGGYKIGHNPAIFYRDLPVGDCRSNDLPVTDLTARSGPLWSALENQALPSLSWVTPNKTHDGEGSSNATTALEEADTWLASFVALIAQSPSYTAGNTLVLVTYDEGFGGDARTGEDCTDKARDLPVTNGISAHQDSCHVPLFVISPFARAGSDGTFFDHYSLTRTVEDLFHLSPLAHATDAQTSSLIGHFGIP